MKKYLIVFLCSLLLVGCGVSEQSVKDEITQTIKDASKYEIKEETNHHRKYFDYYLPRNIGVRANPLLEVENVEFIYDNTSFYMSLDVAEVIIYEYYDQLLKYKMNQYNDIMQVGDSFINRTGEMVDYNYSMRKYKIMVNRIDSNEYFVYVSFGDVYFVALCPLSEVNPLVYNMLIIGRSVRVDSDLVLLDYSNKVNIIYEKSYDLFEKVFPESGIVADVLSDKLSDGKGDEHLHEAEIDEDETLENPDEEFDESIEKEE